MGRLLYEGGRYPHALRVFSETRTAAQHRHPEIALRCAVNEATLHSALGDNARALDLVESSLPHLRRSTDDWTWANAFLNRAVLMRSTASPEEAEKATRAARRAIAGEPDLRVLWAHASLNLADLLFERGRLEESRRLLKRVRRIYRKTGDQTGIAKVLGTFSKIVFAEGDVESAMRVLQMALFHARAGWDQATTARLLNNQGTMQRASGRLAAAEESFHSARRVGLAIGDPEPATVAHMGMVTVALAKGDTDRALWYARRCLKKAEALGLGSLAAQTRGNLGLALLDSGRPEAALREFRRAVEAFRRLGDRQFEAFTEENIASALQMLAGKGGPA